MKVQHLPLSPPHTLLREKHHLLKYNKIAGVKNLLCNDIILHLFKTCQQEMVLVYYPKRMCFTKFVIIRNKLVWVFDDVSDFKGGGQFFSAL